VQSGDLPRWWVLEYPSRPWTTNAERKAHRYERAALTKEWRGAFYWLAKVEQIPRLIAASITAEPIQSRGPLQDTAACNPAVKAAIDGLVDAGVLPDDDGRYVREITFLPARKGNRDALVLTITEVTP
jgi:crossover junction endodeoxyribonuclease RusA